MTDLDPQLSFWEHVEAFRATVIKCLAVIFLGTLLSLFFYPQIFEVFTAPYRNLSEIKRNGAFEWQTLSHTKVRNRTEKEALLTLPQASLNAVPGSKEVVPVPPNGYLVPPGGYVEFDQAKRSELILLSPAEGLTTILKGSFWTGLVGTSPFWLYFILQFVAPALASREKRLLFPFCLLSLIFLGAGFVFAYTVTIPMANTYLAEINHSLGQNFWSLSQYLNYTVLLMLANGLAFEASVILFFLVHFGWISSESMRQKRKGVIVAIFVLSALLTPPDALTQLMLAAPLILIYELAIQYAKFVSQKQLEHNDLRA